MSPNGITPADISVVIPAINEENTIGSAIESALNAGAQEVIVSDGGSNDATGQRAAEAGATKVIRSIPGRGIQLNSGAVFAEGKYVLFLHADNLLDANSLLQICDVPDVVWGAFRQRIDSPKMLFRWIEKGNAARVRVRGMAFGDQAIFVRRDAYKEQGGFAEIPLMEDVDFSKRFRKLAWPRLLPGPVTISPRRWLDRGIVRQTLKNWSIQTSYALGTSPEKLRERYR